MSQQVFSILQNPNGVDFNATEGMALTERMGAGRQKEKLPFFHVHYICFQFKGWVKLKEDLPTSKDL